MKTFPFQQVDVFTDVPFKGNPVAVVLEADAIPVAEMQAIARWTNLSETTFVCSPTDPRADYRLRIFTPQSELPFAGHPTLGSAHAVLRHGLEPRVAGRVVQECGRGLVPVEQHGDRLFLALPAPRFVDLSEVARGRLAETLGIESSAIGHAASIDVGPVWWTVQLSGAQDVLALRPDMEKLRLLMPDGHTGVTVFGAYGPGMGSDVEVRSFAPGEGVPEDPVCGSGNGCVAALVQRHRLIAGHSYSATQGRCLERDGRIAVRFDADGTIWVGGHAVTCIDGSIRR